jgi:hypothetical protein
MSSVLFVVLFFALVGGLYFYINKKWSKRQTEVNEFAFEMQRELRVNTETISKSVNYYKTVQDFYEAKGYSVSKHPDFTTDFMAKKEKEILFIRIQSPQDKQDITAKSFQGFVGQSVLYALDNPLYESYTIKWDYVCSKMLCDQSVRIFMNKYKERLGFELIEVEAL